MIGCIKPIHSHLLNGTNDMHLLNIIYDVQKRSSLYVKHFMLVTVLLELCAS
jgi:hypothetical protein